MTTEPQKAHSFPLQIVVVIVTLLAFGLSLSKAAVVELDVDELFEIKQFVARPLLDFFINYWANGQLPHVLLTKALGIIHWDVFNLRLGSVLAGVLCIPLTYRLADDLFDRRVAALSAFLLSVTITHIRYAAYARGYSLMLMLTLITIYCFSRAMKTAQRRWWIGFAIALAINIHNHVFIIFLVAVLLVFIIGWAWKERQYLLSQHKSQLRNMTIAGALIFFMLLPIPVLLLVSRSTVDSLSLLLANQDWPTSFPPFSMDQSTNIFAPLIQMSYTFSPIRYPGWQTYVFVGFFLIGVVVGLRRIRFRWGTILLLLMLFLPPFLMTLATTILGPWFYALRRYFLFVMLSYLILASLGVLSLINSLTKPLSVSVTPFYPQFIRSGLLLSLIVFITFPIVPYALIDETHPSKPYSIARYIQAHAHPGDLILCVPDQDWRISPRESSCSLILNIYPELAPHVYFLDELAIYQTLQKFLNPDTDCNNHYTHMPHPHFQMECISASNPNKPRNIWLILWRSRQITIESVQADPLHPLTQAAFDSTEIIYLENKNGLASTLTQAGEIALAESKTPLRKFENYVSLANIYAATGDINRAVATLEKAAFVSRWPEAVKRLAELQAQLSFLPVAFEPEINTQIVWNDEIVLEGLDQDLQTIHLAPGEPIQISFYWQTLQPIATDYQIFLHLVDDQGTPVSTFDYQPFDGRRPFTDWPPGQIIRETRTFVLPADLSPGSYTLVLGLYRPDTLERLPITKNATGDRWVLAAWEF